MCNCIKDVESQIEKDNKCTEVRLDSATLLSEYEENGERVTIQFSAYYQDKLQIHHVLALYCPFCGKKY